MVAGRKVYAAGHGHTLIEVLVTLGLVGIAAAVALPRFDARRLRIDAAQRLVIANLRLARASAITTSVHFAVEFAAAAQIQVERMSKDSAGRWQVDPASVQTIPLPASTHFAAGVLGNRIEFNSRGMAVNLTAPQQVAIVDDFGVSKSLQAWPSGQVDAF